jgi:hypothetical protein
MSQAPGSSLPTRKRKSTAAIFVDYDNLYDTLEDRNVETPEQSITTLLNNLVRNIRSEDDAEVVKCSAYADFADLPDGTTIQQSLMRLGCRPSFVDREAQLNASELQLCIDAIADTRGTSLDFVVVVSGSRQYLPLLQSLRAEGRRVKLVALVSPTTRALAGLERQSFMHAARMLGDAAGFSEEDDDADRPTASDSKQSREYVEHREVENPAGIRTLRIVEEFFGQYDEVYLTPLLRKLSALLEDDEPKTVIAELEECGAVWLEKRQGFPYDYTVLAVDDDHPTVLRLRQELHNKYDEIASDPDEIASDPDDEPTRRRRRRIADSGLVAQD